MPSGDHLWGVLSSGGLCSVWHVCRLCTLARASTPHWLYPQPSQIICCCAKLHQIAEPEIIVSVLTCRYADARHAHALSRLTAEQATQEVQLEEQAAAGQPEQLPLTQ